MRSAFERARRDGALDTVPGLVYLAPARVCEEPVLIDTGLQRLVRASRRIAREAIGARVCSNRRIAAPGSRTQPLAAAQSQPSCPDREPAGHPGVQVHLLAIARFRPSIRRAGGIAVPRRSPATIRSIYDRFRIKYFFGADDNFFNQRETAEAMLTRDGPFDGGPVGLFANESALRPKRRSSTPTRIAICCRWPATLASTHSGSASKT